jgi:hypothetical protein
MVTELDRAVIGALNPIHRVPPFPPLRMTAVHPADPKPQFRTSNFGGNSNASRRASVFIDELRGLRIRKPLS